MAKIELRPMTLGEVLDRTFSLYKGNFCLFAGLVAIPYLVLVVFTLVFASSLVSTLPTAGAAAATPPTPAAMGRLLGAALGGTALFVLVYLFLFAAAQAATVVAVSDLYLGRPLSLHGSYARISRRIPTVLLVMLGMLLLSVGAFLIGLFGPIGITALFLLRGGPRALLAIAVLIGMLLGMASWVVVTCRLAVAVPAATLENTGAGTSIWRSLRLTKGHSLEIFAVLVLVVFLAVVCSFVFQIPIFLAMGSPLQPHAIPFWLTAADGLATWLSDVIVAPIGAIALALIYYNLRIRKEAFDLEQLISSLEPDASPTFPSPA